jgi:pyridinium-3,5-biscarboxylic acid mononucleotide synthase
LYSEFTGKSGSLREILTRLSNGKITVSEAQKEISIFSIESVGDNLAKIDISRDIRKLTPEVILSEGKDSKDVIRIALSVLAKRNLVVISRIKEPNSSVIHSSLKRKGFVVEVGSKSSTILVSKKNSLQISNTTKPTIGILAAGTSDIGVAEECRLIAKAMGCGCLTSYDVGIAGIHRLFPKLKEMVYFDVSTIIVVAGMEGALPSVVSSLVDIPVIAVPTSTGYGFGSNGAAALGTMLQSCSLGLAVVNIDNGIGAGAFAATIARRRVKM